MANESTTTSLAELLPTIKQEAQYQAEEATVMRNLVRNYDLPFSTGTTVNVPKWGVLSAADLTEGTDMANTEVTTTESVLTVAERGVMATLTDLAMRTSQENAMSGVAGVLGRAMARKIDQDIIANFDNFSVVVGGATTTATVALIEEAITTLEAQNLSRDDLVIVLHPKIFYDVNANLTNTFANPNGGAIQDEFMTTGFAQMINGVPAYKSANIADAVGVSKGAIFHRDALGYASLVDWNIEPERDASLRATELNATATYATGEVWDEYGVELHFLSTLG